MSTQSGQHVLVVGRSGADASFTLKRRAAAVAAEQTAWRRATAADKLPIRRDKRRPPQSLHSHSHSLFHESRYKTVSEWDRRRQATGDG